MRYDKKDIDTLTDHINQLDFGLTLGIHTRIEKRATEIASKVNVGNVYINRPMIGSIVGAQPFGGTQQSGTNQKSGGPYTLLNFTYQKVITQNLTGVGASANLSDENFIAPSLTTPYQTDG